MRWRSWVIITPPKRDDPIYPSKTPYGFSAAERLRSTGHSTSVRFSFAFSGDFERYGDSSPIGQPHSFRVAKNNRSKSVCTLFQRKHLNNQTVWPVIFGL